MYRLTKEKEEEAGTLRTVIEPMLCVKKWNKRRKQEDGLKSEN